MGKNILVVDNHPVMLRLMARLLEKEGNHVRTAEDGLSALDLLKDYRPDVIFTDLVMPRIDGAKLCQMIRKKPELKDVYVVIFSAIAAEGERNLLDVPADACIAKGPFEKMARHVFDVLHQLDEKGAGSETVIGLQDVYPRQITRELLSIKRQFEATLKSMAEGIAETTWEGRIVYANPAFLSLISVPEEKLLTSNVVDLFQDGDRQRVRDVLTTVHTHPRSISEDAPVRLDGKEVSVNIFPIIDESQRSLIFILNDLSERKRMEAQILQTQKMEAIGTLAGGIAHDFNNLMMVIQGNVSVMLMDIESGHPFHERLKDIEKKVKSGAKLTSQLLGYARKGRYEVKAVDLNQLVEETSQMFGRTRKEVTVYRELAHPLFPIAADQGQMEQVLMNLLVNAADAMPSGGELWLKTANVSHRELAKSIYHPREGDYALLTVKDTGIGMDPKTVDRIFDPFFTTKEPGKGTGLGLASVYGIIKGHNGYIDVESSPGRGTSFRIYLPASKEKPEESVRVQDTAILRGKETVLLVDDEEMILKAGQKMLEAMGYQTLRAQTGREAIEAYREHMDRIDLVILDLVMPQMGGGEVFDRLKEINPGVKVLISSGYSIDGEASKILERGGHGFIQKPFDLRQLSHSLRSILD